MSKLALKWMIYGRIKQRKTLKGDCLHKNKRKTIKNVEAVGK